MERKKALIATLFIMLCLAVPVIIMAVTGSPSLQDGNGGNTLIVEDRNNDYVIMRVKGNAGDGSLLTMEEFATGTSVFFASGSQVIAAAPAFLVGACAMTNDMGAVGSLALFNAATTTDGSKIKFAMGTSTAASNTVCITLPAPAYFSSGIYASETNLVSATIFYRLASW